MDENLTLDISVVLPVYNEAENIGSIIKEIVQVFEKSEFRYEVIVVDDGSEDGTPEVLMDLLHNFQDNLKVARHVRNRGNGAAIRTGIRASRGKIVVTMDADGQHSPEDILLLLEQIPPYDLVIASRTEQYRGRWYRGVANRFFNRFASWLSRSRVLDLTSGFRAMRRAAVDHFLPLLPEGFSAPTTTTLAFLKGGYNVAFVPIHVRERKAGKSKISIWTDGSRFIMVILRMIMLYDPLRIFVPTGLFLGAMGILAGVAGILNAGRIVLANSAILLLLAGLITWLLGFIASQISSTLIQYHGDETIVFIDPTD